MRRSALLAASAMLGATSAPAQDKIPTPAAAAAREADDPSKFFLFHRAGVGAETARSDYLYCGSLVATTMPPAGMGYGDGSGLIGAIVNQIQDSTEVRRIKDASMRRCMSLHGYERYHVPEAQWNEIVRAPDALDRMVAFTTGPTPATRRLEP